MCVDGSGCSPPLPSSNRVGYGNPMTLKGIQWMQKIDGHFRQAFSCCYLNGSGVMSLLKRSHLDPNILANIDYYLNGYF